MNNKEYIEREAAIQATTLEVLGDPHPSEAALLATVHKKLRAVPAADVIPPNELVRRIFLDVKRAIREEALRFCNEFERAKDSHLEAYFKNKQDTVIFLYMKIDSLEREYMEVENDS